MNRITFLPIAALMLATFLPAGVAAAQQTLPTAARTMQLSAFGGLTGVDTGLIGGKNLSLSLGGDLGFVPFHRVRPTLEIRGVIPMDGGQVDSQKAIFVGGKFDFLLNHRLRPYADFLYGRGQIKYQHGGYLYGPFIYVQTTTNVLSPGGGIDYDLDAHYSIKVDAQIQRWSGAPTLSGNIYPIAATAGIVYHFNFGEQRLP